MLQRISMGYKFRPFHNAALFEIIAHMINISGKIIQ